MGADFLVSLLYIERNKTLDKTLPDWEAGKKALVDLEEDDQLGPTPTEEDIDDLKGAWEGNYRDTAIIDVGIYAVILSGGMSWGDDPTDTFTTINKIASYEKVRQALGFLWVCLESEGYGMVWKATLDALLSAHWV